ncbi:MAG: 13E12 repeat family protein [Actinomycetota bacterium]|nr:13E12 repeat family protein [Actinomycetota bacterium]
MSSLKVIDEPVPLAELDDRIVGLAGRLAAATCRWLLLVAEFDRREGFAGWGLASTARWLSHTCGLSRRTALEHVRVAVALRDIPALAAEMRRGRLSYSQVRAISRGVEPGDDVVVADRVQAAQHCRPTMSDIGSTVAAPIWTTSSCSAKDTTARTTTASSRSPRSAGSASRSGAEAVST